MSVQKSASALVALVAATLLLAGCGDDVTSASAPASPAPASASATTPAVVADAAPVSPCPTLTVGAVIPARTFASCVGAALESSAGYAATGTVFGEPATVRHDPARSAFDVATARGDVVGIGADIWVRPAGDAWSVADVAADDSDVRELSALAVQAAQSLPSLVTGEVMGEVTVTAVTADAITVSGAQAVETLSVTGEYVVRPDFSLVSAAVTATSSAREVSLDLDVTAWNTEQNITAPL